MSINFYPVDRKKKRRENHWHQFRNSPCAEGSRTWHSNGELSVLGKELASSKKEEDQHGNVTWEKDVLERNGFLFCRICPSCKGIESRPIFLDVQCHGMELRDSGLAMPDYVRIGNWSDVQCDTCGMPSKFGNWYEEDLKIRPTETVFNSGSRCWSTRRVGGCNQPTVFSASRRKKDNGLIWRIDHNETERCGQAIRSAVGIVSVCYELVLSKFLDLPYIHSINHNDLVRTRTDAAKEILSSI